MASFNVLESSVLTLSNSTFKHFIGTSIYSDNSSVVYIKGDCDFDDVYILHADGYAEIEDGVIGAYDNYIISKGGVIVTNSEETNKRNLYIIFVLFVIILIISFYILFELECKRRRKYLVIF